MTDALVEAVARAIWSSSSGGDRDWDTLDVFTRGGLKDDATSALQAIEAAGYRVVAVEATEERLTAMAKVREGDQPYYILDMYREMYGAAIGGER